MITNIDHAERAHARLSASRIQRVLLCPGSLMAEEALPPQPSSEAALRGTVIHELSEALLANRPLPEEVDEELLAVAVGYVKAVEQFTSGAKKRFIELDVTEHLKTLHPSLGGTADLVAIGGGTLTVADLKTGRLDVDPEWNPQLLTYAVGAALALNAPSNIKVRLAIYQPDAGGWKEWHCAYPDLMDWADRLKDIAERAHRENAPRHPSVDACKYCRAKPHCSELRQQALTVARQEFGLDKTDVLHAPEVTTDMLDDAALCAAWAESVQVAAKAQLIEKPDSIVGWKLRDGRKMIKWKDEKIAAAVLADKREAWTLKSASTIQKMGFELPTGLFEETRTAASLVKVK